VTLAIILLALLSGCTGVQNLRVLQDSPEDIEQLLEQDEYARIRQLTGRHPEIDTPALQELVRMREAAYAETVITTARRQEEENDLLGAVQGLSVALQRVPHNDELRELRHTLERERVQQLKRNERERLIARASYMLEQQALYQQQVNLAHPSLVQRWENSRHEKEAVLLAGQLQEHGEYALLQNDLATAETCLQLSLELNHTATANETLSQLQSLRASHQQVEEKKASIKQAKKKRSIQRSQWQLKEDLLAETRQALEQNDLQKARAAFERIPASFRNSPDVNEVREILHKAVNTRVTELVAKGDSLYRADNVLEALQNWNEARSLDPENLTLKERIDRANKVLARLEELKRQQP
jgi:tetratricopeptide (TPR) repeat protein